MAIINVTPHIPVCIHALKLGTFCMYKHTLQSPGSNSATIVYAETQNKAHSPYMTVNPYLFWGLEGQKYSVHLEIFHKVQSDKWAEHFWKSFSWRTTRNQRNCVCHSAVGSLRHELQKSINQRRSSFIMSYLLINRRRSVHLYRAHSTGLSRVSGIWHMHGCIISFAPRHL